MVARNSVWVSVFGGLACVGLGAVLGSAWPDSRAAQVWTEAPPVRQPGVVPSFAEVVQHIAPGVVTVRAVRAGEPPAIAGSPESAGGLRAVHAQRAGMRSGSGFVVSPRGLVVTSLHVVEGAFDIEVIVPGRAPFVGEIVGDDPATDLALLRLANVTDELTALPLAGGGDLRAGDWIVAVGNPFGYAQTVTAGIVSFVGRHLLHSDFGVTNDFLQISAPVNPGSSGCPVVDLQGRVVGVTTQAPVDAQGISFAVPSRTVRWTLDEMQRAPGGHVRRGYLGIEFLTYSRGADHGAVVTQVKEGAPAHRAGMRAGDVVVRVDDMLVGDAGALHERILSSRPGTQLALRVLRDGREDAPDSIVAVLGEVGARTTGQPN